MTVDLLAMAEYFPPGKYDNLGTMEFAFITTRLKSLRKKSGVLSPDIPHFRERCKERRITEEEAIELRMSGEVTTLEINLDPWETGIRERYILRKRSKDRTIDGVFEVRGDALIGITAYVP